MLVDIFLLILSTGVPATRLNAQFNYVSILSYVMCSMYVSIRTKLCHVFHVCEYAASFVPCCACVGKLLLQEIAVAGCDLDHEMLRTFTTI